MIKFLDFYDVFAEVEYYFKSVRLADEEINVNSENVYLVDMVAFDGESPDICNMPIVVNHRTDEYYIPENITNVILGCNGCYDYDATGNKAQKLIQAYPEGNGLHTHPTDSRIFNNNKITISVKV